MTSLLIHRSVRDPTPNLVVIISHVKEDVSPVVLQEVFKDFTASYRFPSIKPTHITYLLEYASAEAATAVREATKSRTMFRGCNLVMSYYFPVGIRAAVLDGLPADYIKASEEETMLKAAEPVVQERVPPAPPALPAKSKFKPNPKVLGESAGPQAAPLPPGRGPCTLVFQNIPETVSLAQLFSICAVYGDVIRMKRNDTSTVLVQYNVPSRANVAATLLTQCPFEDVILQPRIGDANENLPAGVALSGSGDPSDPSTREFEFLSTPAHMRYDMNPQHRRLLRDGNIAPSEHLYFYNIPPETSDTDLIEFVCEAGCGLITFDRTSPSTASVEVSDVAEAVQTLVKLHDAELGGHKIKVVFSSPGNDCKEW
eukprot:PhM_4_TR17017/c0_g1_i1/m.18546